MRAFQWCFQKALKPAQSKVQTKVGQKYLLEWYFLVSLAQTIWLTKFLIPHATDFTMISPTALPAKVVYASPVTTPQVHQGHNAIDVDPEQVTVPFGISCKQVQCWQTWRQGRQR
jgi:hypothetical protein